MSIWISPDDYKNQEKHRKAGRYLACGKEVTAEYIEPEKGLFKMHLKICERCRLMQEKAEQNPFSITEVREPVSRKLQKRKKDSSLPQFFVMGQVKADLEL